MHSQVSVKNIWLNVSIVIHRLMGEFHSWRISFRTCAWCCHFDTHVELFMYFGLITNGWFNNNSVMSLKRQTIHSQYMFPPSDFLMLHNLWAKPWQALQSSDSHFLMCDLLSWSSFYQQIVLPIFSSWRRSLIRVYTLSFPFNAKQHVRMGSSLQLLQLWLKQVYKTSYVRILYNSLPLAKWKESLILWTRYVWLLLRTLVLLNSGHHSSSTYSKGLHSFETLEIDTHTGYLEWCHTMYFIFVFTFHTIPPME